ncbi:hypothetical protein Bpfe_011007 [Biomphalaria pfeifferi]|uniref:Uncharacterized protein n=1 Tax=Biomphalaria pfeifferi TaxID=112525 RepID=A0AAD8BRN4_BIOPF|nr:hypothetical protein Bpfe_011007 [Biomphalaria pfeifferi]
MSRLEKQPFFWDRLNFCRGANSRTQPLKAPVQLRDRLYSCVAACTAAWPPVQLRDRLYSCVAACTAAWPPVQLRVRLYSCVTACTAA